MKLYRQKIDSLARPFANYYAVAYPQWLCIWKAGRAPINAAKRYQAL
jgi:hypothetical protein